MKFDQEKLKGMLWGLVVGDCMGSPIQFTSKKHHREITKMEPAIDVYFMDLPKGYWTDDSSMAFCIMESVIQNQGYDLKDIAANFLRWYDTGFLSSCSRAFDIGRATHMAMQGLRKGELKNGVDSSQGNGSIMRFAPSFILAEACGRPEINIEIGDLTHCSSELHQLLDELRLTFLALMENDSSRIHSTHTRESVPNSGWAFDTIEAAYWAFCNYPTFREGMLAAVNLGGDSDSIGAVYGQLAGAYFGFSAIPQEWIHDVKDWQEIDARIAAFLNAIDIIRNNKQTK